MSHPIVDALGSSDPEERRDACRRAAGDPSAVLLIDALVEALADPVKAVSREACDALTDIGRSSPDAHVLKRALKRALYGDDPRQRWSAAFTSARLAPPTPGLLPALVEAMGSPDGDVRWSAARLLVELGRTHPEVLGVVLRLVAAGDTPEVRRMSAFALRELAPDHPGAASALLEATYDDDVQVRRAAYTALAALIDPPPEVLEKLSHAIGHDSDPASCRIAAVALGELGAVGQDSLPPSALASLERARDGGDDADLSRAAQRALARLSARHPATEH